ncbi:hypothetical protein AQJ30_27560 [Streptomyces longwoodensis]|uniref:Uncharacterized protein n=1 Tax=Streptomyces longwoodensis TaxID=68231 RepID=A0A117QLF7_9ACTN|nr:DUF6093 family protein [Streptomyces longwoodensis]KUN34829.1 hypothetical protein AQJ30_27560 [Streptomyces longwoodensis]
MSSLDTVLARGRAAAKARMRDTVHLYSQAPDVFDRSSGNTVPGAKTTLYEGRARVKPVAQAGEDTEASEREVRLLEYEVSLPWDTPLPPGTRVLPGMRVEVTASRDARMVGLVLWVTGTQYGEQATAWRLTTEDRT